MAVYLIHFDRPLAHARHYIGYARSVPKRLEAHHNGNGARLLEVLRERGIGYEVVRTWPGGTRQLERQLKRQKNGPRLCPICNPTERKNHGQAA